MQIYSKLMKNATSPLFRNHNRSALPAGTYITHRVIYYSLVQYTSVFSMLWLTLSPTQPFSMNNTITIPRTTPHLDNSPPGPVQTTHRGPIPIWWGFALAGSCPDTMNKHMCYQVFIRYCKVPFRHMKAIHTQLNKY